VGAGGDITGVVVGGIGAGAGGTLRGLGIGGLGVGATTVEGVLVSGLAAGGLDVTGLVVAPGYLKIEKDGVFRGVSVAAFNRVRGSQHGVTIGILNYARQLNGIQLGLLNFAGNNRTGLRWLPLFNAHFD
jgi:hypothetical protein